MYSKYFQQLGIVWGKKAPWLDRERLREALDKVDGGGGIAALNRPDPVGRRVGQPGKIALAEVASGAIQLDIEAEHLAELSSFGGFALHRLNDRRSTDAGQGSIRLIVDRADTATKSLLKK